MLVSCVSTAARLLFVRRYHRFYMMLIYVTFDGRRKSAKVIERDVSIYAHVVN